VLADGPNPGAWRGIAAMGRAWGETISAFADLTVDAEEIRTIDDERVLVLTHNRGRGKTSGLELGEMATRGANLFTLGDGKVVRLALYFDRERAFEDLDT
jgi:hypothetical protein